MSFDAYKLLLGSLLISLSAIAAEKQFFKDECHGVSTSTSASIVDKKTAQKLFDQLKENKNLPWDLYSWGCDQRALGAAKELESIGFTVGRIQFFGKLQVQIKNPKYIEINKCPAIQWCKTPTRYESPSEKSDHTTTWGHHTAIF